MAKNLLKINVSISSIRAASAILKDPRLVRKAIARAINKTVVWARARILDYVVSEMNLKKADIRSSQFRIFKAHQDAGRLFARIKMPKKRIPLIKFGAQQTKAGVISQIGRGGVMKLEPHTFIARMKSGHKGVFVRAGKARLPIIQRTGPSLGNVARRAVAATKCIPDAKQRLADEVRRQIRVILGGYDQRRGVAGPASPGGSAVARRTA